VPYGIAVQIIVRIERRIVSGIFAQNTITRPSLRFASRGDSGQGNLLLFQGKRIEHAFVHQLRDKAEAAYARGDLLEKRRALMQARADYCTEEKDRMPKTRMVP
jgi:hypothetical protein